MPLNFLLLSILWGLKCPLSLLKFLPPILLGVNVQSYVLRLRTDFLQRLSHFPRLLLIGIWRQRLRYMPLCPGGTVKGLYRLRHRRRLSHLRALLKYILLRYILLRIHFVSCAQSCGNLSGKANGTTHPVNHIPAQSVTAIVNTSAEYYVLTIILPGFDQQGETTLHLRHSSRGIDYASTPPDITVATRRSRAIQVMADKWDGENSGMQFLRLSTTLDMYL